MGKDHLKIGVLGLGYVGLPLAVAFAAHHPVIGFDIDPDRVAELHKGHDRTGEVPGEVLSSASALSFSAEPDKLEACQVFIITVPTPITPDKQPDLRHMHAASATVGAVLKPGDLVVVESTVFPGATEEECVPILERESGLRFNKDFFAGYSPERINPGDRTRRIGDIVKVVAGSTPEATERLAELYGMIVSAGIYRAESIRIAEAAKVIENTQRDLNIALINELSIIFRRMGLDTEAVLKAAGTKWNFQPFRPGLVGGHCIGVDPYYLTHKAEAVGYHPEIILAGRRLNDSMAQHVASEMLTKLVERGIGETTARVLVMGISFKENTPDARNSQVVTLVLELRSLGLEVDVWDPLVDADWLEDQYGIRLIASPEHATYDGIIIAVGHQAFHALGAPAIRAFGKENHVLFDLKYVLATSESDSRL